MKDLQLLLLEVLHTPRIVWSSEELPAFDETLDQTLFKAASALAEALPCWVASANAQQLQCAQLCGFGTHCYVPSQSYAQIWKHFSQCVGERIEASLLPHHWSEIIGRPAEFLYRDKWADLFAPSERIMFPSQPESLHQSESVSLCAGKSMARMTSFLMHALPKR